MISEVPEIGGWHCHDKDATEMHASHVGVPGVQSQLCLQFTRPTDASLGGLASVPTMRICQCWPFLF